MPSADGVVGGVQPRQLQHVLASDPAMVATGSLSPKASTLWLDLLALAV